jgi:hypothetical protein
MPHTLRFRDHEEFHRAALHMAVAGGLAGLAVHVAGLVFPGFGPAWATAGLVGAVGFAAQPPAWRVRVGEIGLTVAVVLAVGVSLLFVGSRTELGLAAAAAGFAVLAVRGGRRAWATMAGAAGALFLARYVEGTFGAAGAAAGLAPWLVAGVSGLAFGFVGVLGLLPRHIEIGASRVEAAYEACRGKLAGEVRELADRAMGVWEKVDKTLEPEAAARRAIEDSVVRVFDVAQKWASVESDGARTPADALIERMDAISAKVERTEDAVARKQYQDAHAALAEQLRYLREIATARERVIARMHHYLAAMERLRFAVLNNRSADASRVSTEVQPILDDLRDLGRDIDCSSEAIHEVEKDEVALTRPSAQA